MGIFVNEMKTYNCLQAFMNTGAECMSVSVERMRTRILWRRVPYACHRPPPEFPILEHSVNGSRGTLRSRLLELMGSLHVHQRSPTLTVPTLWPPAFQV
jgi:hypothetical protein